MFNAEVLLTLVMLCLSLAILWTGRRAGLYRHYPVFYLYIASLVAIDAAMWTWIVLSGSYNLETGLNSATYYYVFWARATWSKILETVLLLKLYRRFHFGDSFWIKVIIVLALAMITGVFIDHGVENTNDVFLFNLFLWRQFQTLFCALIMAYVAVNPRLLIGWNEFAILTGLGVHFLGRYLLWASDALDPQSFGAMKFVATGFETMQLLIWAWALRSYHPTQVLPSQLGDERKRRRRDYEKAVQSLLQR